MIALPERSVASISRSSAFISGTVSLRLARTAPWQAIVDSSSSRAVAMRRLSPCSRRSASTSRNSASTSPSASNAGTLRNASDCGPLRVTSKPNCASCRRFALGDFGFALGYRDGHRHQSVAVCARPSPSCADLSFS
jgi:hypothetical protein